MREILFRGAQKVDGSKSLYWYEGFLVSEKDCYTGEVEYYIENENGSFLVIPETVGQYTGLKDKNGTKIFEGDIIKHYFEIGVVRFGSYETPYRERSVIMQDIFSKHIGFYIDWTTLNYRKDIEFWKNKIKIIGNIRDNPELLKEAEQELKCQKDVN